MKRSEIKSAVEKHLTALGFPKGSWVWQPATAELMVVVAGSIRRVKLPSGLSKRQLTWELGRMYGWAEQAGIKPVTKANGVHHKGAEANSQLPA